MTDLTIDWYIKNRVILVTIITQFFAIDEIKQMNDTLIDLIHASEESVVDLVIDGRKIESFQMNITLITQSLTFMREQKLGWTILLSNDKLMNLTATIVAHMAQARLRNANTVEEAAKFLKKIDPALELP